MSLGVYWLGMRGIATYVHGGGLGGILWESVGYLIWSVK